MSFEVTVTPTVYNVEVEVNPSVQPFDVVVEVGNVPDLDLTTNGDSGASTFDPLTGELNIPEYTLDGLGGVPESRTLTINGTTQDLSANRTFTIATSTPVTIGSPANGLSITSGQVLSLALASGSQTGALSSGDWTIFNGKQNALGFTAENVANKSTLITLGTSDTLYPTQNAVKSYVDTGLSGKQNTLGFTAENVANKAINLTSPDDTKYPTTLAVSTALAGKQNTLTNPITGTGVSGQVAFFNGTSSQTGNSALTWDNVNLNIETGVSGGGTLSARVRNTNNGGISSFRLVNDNTSNYGSLEIFGSLFGATSLRNVVALTSGTDSGSNIVLFNNGASAHFRIVTTTSLTERFRLFGNTGNVLIQNGGTFTDAGFRLDVNGTARVQGALSTTADATFNTVIVGLGGGSIATNTRVGLNALSANTTGGSNTGIGVFALQNNTTGSSNTSIGSASLRNINSGSENTAFGSNSGRFIADGVTLLTTSNNSIFIGSGASANGDNQTNQIVIGRSAIGLGSNTTVIGNSSTTFGRWWGNLLIGTSTNQASSVLTMESTTRGFLPPRMTSTERNAIATPATGLVVYNTTNNMLSVYNGTAWVDLATV